LLVAGRGWAPQRFQEWLAAALIGQLLPAPPAHSAPQAGEEGTR
jgi:hypothetical protein